MKKFREMDAREKRVLRACQNGWWLSGVYQAQFDDHKKMFEVDSIPMLYNEVERWHGSHAENHGDATILVRCAYPC